MGRPAFEVDREGLRKLLARKGYGFAVLELLQNALDEDVTHVAVRLEWDGKRRLATIVVVDDAPEGFADLRHAYTLFAESAKKTNPGQRGRFNLGEKLVVAACTYASVTTTTGTVTWEGNERRHSSKSRDAGTIFAGAIHMSRAEYDDALALLWTVLPPAGVKVEINGLPLDYRPPLRTFDVTLPTEIADDDGTLRRTRRATKVEVVEVHEGEQARLYELGLPVQDVDDRFHVNVLQKVPLSIDRAHVTPAYLRDVRRAVLDHCHDLLSGDDAAESWVTDALEDDEVSPVAVDAALTLRFGAKRVSFDPSDPEANKRAVAAGYTVVHARQLPKAAWDSIRRANTTLAQPTLRPAGQVTPSPTPYSTDPDAPVRSTLPESQWSDAIHGHARFARWLAKSLLGISIDVVIVNDPMALNFIATWRRSSPLGPACLEWNLRRLGHVAFAREPDHERMLATLIHEMAHERVDDHLSDDFHEECCRLGAAAARLALANPSSWDAATGRVLAEPVA